MHLTWLWHDEFYKFAFGDRSEYCLYSLTFKNSLVCPTYILKLLF